MSKIHPVSRYETRIVESISTPQERQKLTPAALKGFFKLAKSWDLTDQESRQILGDIPQSTYYSWKSSTPKSLDQDLLLRISYLLGIYKALHILYDKKLADAWIKLPNSNPLFGGKSPVSTIAVHGISALHEVRSLLDNRRGGH